MILDDRMTVTRRIDASAAAIFALICDPNGHVKIDGSGMLVAAQDSKAVTAVGDVFRMNMDREPLGDLPMGKYQVINTVTTFVPEVELAWAVSSTERPAIGHWYGYRLEPVDEHQTDVANYCDWSEITDAARARLSWPVVPESMLQKSLHNLAAVLSEADPQADD